MREKKENNVSIKQNYLYNLIYQLIVVLSPVIVTPYISRVFGADTIGMYQYVYSIAGYFSIFVLLGTSIYGQREVASNKNDSKILGDLFIHIQAVKGIMLLCSIVIYSIILIKARGGKYFNLLFIEIFLLFASFVDISWFFYGLEKFKTVSARSSVIKILTIICIFIFVKDKTDLIKYAAIMSVGTLTGNLLLWIYIPRYCHITRIRKEYFNNIWKSAWFFLIPNVATQIYVHLDKLLLGMIAGDFETGYYSQGEKVVKLVLTLITSLSLVLLPRITYLVSNGQKDIAKEKIIYTWKVVLMFSLPMMVGLMTISNKFVPIFFGEGYEPVSQIIKILSPITVLIGSNSVLGYAILIPFRQQKSYTISAVIGCILNLLVNVCLIPGFGAIGACIGTFIAEGSVCVIQYLYARKIMGPFIPLFSSLKYFLGSFIMGAFMRVIMSTNYFSGWKLILAIFLGSIVYFGLLILAKDEIVGNCIKLLKRKINK